MKTTFSILTGDALTLLRTLPDNSVHCVVTSPPYWGLRTYDMAGQLGMERKPEEYVAKLVTVLREVRRVLRRDGTAWVNLGDSYANDSKWGGATGGKHVKGLHGGPIGRGRRDTGLKPKDLCMMPARVALALQADGWYLRQEIIWHKPNPMPESVRDRCTKSHEYIYLLAKSERYYFDADAIKEPASQDTHARYARGRSAKHKYADGGPGNQTIAKSFEHMRDRPPAGWHQGTRAAGSAPRDRRSWKGSQFHTGKTAIHQLGRSSVNRAPGVHPKSAPAGSGIKANESFSAAVKDIVEFRNKRSVWKISTQPFKQAHFATFPEKLVEPCVLAGCPYGRTVLDVFAGSGTVGVVALRHGRHFLGLELNPKYVTMARDRITQSSLKEAVVA